MQIIVSVDGGWGSWESWGLCSLSSSRSCQQSRIRYCDNPEPKGSGLFCAGDDTENLICDTESCNCEYSRLYND